jgi:hypothetical protein
MRSCERQSVHIMIESIDEQVPRQPARCIERPKDCTQERRQPMKFKYSLSLALIQVVLVVISVIVDQSINNGLGEGKNQVIANLLSNIEFFIKAGVGLSDIVNFRFIFITAIIGVILWFLVGLFIDYLLHRKPSNGKR